MLTARAADEDRAAGRQTDVLLDVSITRRFDDAFAPPIGRAFEHARGGLVARPLELER